MRPGLFGSGFKIHRILDDSHHRILSTHLDDARMSVTLDDTRVSDTLTRDAVPDATLCDVGVDDCVTRGVAATMSIQDGDAALILPFDGVDLVAAKVLRNVGDDDDVVFRRQLILPTPPRHRWRPFRGT